jgi:ferredoxin
VERPARAGYSIVSVPDGRQSSAGRRLQREFSMPKITFANEKKEIQVPEGANLRREALQAGVALYPGIHKVVNCHGLGQCGACRVLVTKGMENCSPKGFMEKTRLGVSLAYIGNEETMRLACQTRVNGDITVTTCPPMNLFGENFFS